MRARNIGCWMVALLACANVLAVDPGLYLGLMGGVAENAANRENVQAANSPTTFPASPDSTQRAGRLFIGEKFTRYFSLEAGVTAYSQIKYSTGTFTPCSEPVTRVTTIDLVGVGTLPLKHGFSLFGKLGGAFLYISNESSLHPNLASDCGDCVYTSTVKPTLSLGGSYDINNHWVADLSWTRTAANGMLNHLNFYALGLSYHFTDITCGPFMCF